MRGLVLPLMGETNVVKRGHIVNGFSNINGSSVLVYVHVHDIVG